jgi:hypothetical protein
MPLSLLRHHLERYGSCFRIPLQAVVLPSCSSYWSACIFERHNVLRVRELHSQAPNLFTVFQLCTNHIVFFNQVVVVVVHLIIHSQLIWSIRQSQVPTSKTNEGKCTKNASERINTCLVSEIQTLTVVFSPFAFSLQTIRDVEIDSLVRSTCWGVLKSSRPAYTLFHVAEGLFVKNSRFLVKCPCCMLLVLVNIFITIALTLSTRLFQMDQENETAIVH